MEEDDLNRIYDAITSLSKRVAELDQKNSEIASVLSGLAAGALSQPEPDQMILDQESTVVDPYNISGHKNFSLPTGGVIKVKSKSMCVNGLHLVDDQSKITFCSRCGAIICKDHMYDLDENLCVNCLKKELKEFNSLDIYLLNAVYNNIAFKDVKRQLRLSSKEISESASKLVASGCIKKDLMFRYFLTGYGAGVLKMGVNLYSISLPQEGMDHEPAAD